MRSKVEDVLSMDIMGEDDATVDQPISSPYLSYGNGNDDERSIRNPDKARPKTGKKSKSNAVAPADAYYAAPTAAASAGAVASAGSSRPKSASRRRDEPYGRQDDYANEEMYPTSRGLVRK